MKGRTGSTLSRTKYVKCFRVETSCYYRLVLNFIVTVELLYDQVESDFVQYRTKMLAFTSRICSEVKQIELNWNRIVHQNALWSLVLSTTRPWGQWIFLKIWVSENGSYRIRLNQRLSLWYGWELRWIQLGCGLLAVHGSPLRKKWSKYWKNQKSRESGLF